VSDKIEKIPRVRVRGPKDMMDIVISKLGRMRPRDDKEGTFEVRRSTKSILTRVSHILKTGLEPLDDLTGCICFGRVTEIYGLETSGKTALVKTCLIQAQKREIYECIYDGDSGGVKELRRINDDVDVIKVFIDNEHSVDDDESVRFPDPEHPERTIPIDCVLGDCDTVDQMFKIVDNTIKVVSETAKEREKQTKKPYRYLIMIVVDTIAGTSSKEEMTAEWGVEDYPRQAKQLRKGFRRLSRIIGRHNVCMICTNQVSETYQKKHGNSLVPQDKDYNTFGGKALKYYASLRIFLFNTGMKYVLVAKARNPAGFLVTFFTAKNRRVKPLREGRLSLLFGDKDSGVPGGLNPLFSKLETLISLGFAEVSKGAPYDIRFRFSHWKIPTTTFGGVSAEEAAKQLEVEDESRRDSDPRITNRAAWPAFYNEHRADVDALWKRAMKYAFSTEGLSEFTATEEDAVDDIVEVEEDDDDKPCTRRSRRVVDVIEDT
jgi:RecA/RadA recombinase